MRGATARPWLALLGVCGGVSGAVALAQCDAGSPSVSATPVPAVPQTALVGAPPAGLPSTCSAMTYYVLPSSDGRCGGGDVWYVCTGGVYDAYDCEDPGVGWTEAPPASRGATTSSSSPHGTSSSTTSGGASSGAATASSATSTRATTASSTAASSTTGGGCSCSEESAIPASVTVKDAMSGAPIVDARLTLAGGSLSGLSEGTGAGGALDGVYTFVGTGTLTVAAAGYASKTVPGVASGVELCFSTACSGYRAPSIITVTLTSAAGDAGRDGSEAAP